LTTGYQPPRRPRALPLAARIGAACFGASLLLAFGSADGRGAAARAHREGPPPGHTGGFGEPTCHTCHFDNPVDARPGALVLAGVPERYQPGLDYAIGVVLARPGLLSAGFQISARFADGRQAGTFRVSPADARRVGVAAENGVQYGHHLEDGIDPAAADTARWTLLWTAPAAAAGTITFHATANAGNDDWSPLGDFIYTAAARTHP
jgi:hypothetical protein